MVSSTHPPPPLSLCAFPVKKLKPSQVFGTTSVALERMVRHQSPFGHLKGWQLAHFIVKAGDDFRMEALAMQVSLNTVQFSSRLHSLVGDIIVGIEVRYMFR